MRTIIIILLITGLCIAVGVSLFLPEIKRTYYYSDDKRQSFTKLEYRRSIFASTQTYIIADVYNADELPMNYISPKSVDRDGYWDVFVGFSKGKIILLNGTGMCDVKDNYNKFIFVNNAFHDYNKLKYVDSLYKQMTRDTSKNVYHFESYHIK